VVKNLKHKAMLTLMFFTCLKATELCSLDADDIDLQKLTLRIREGKGGREGMVGFSNDCGTVMKAYLGFRPPMKIDGRNPLFYTDFGIMWDRKTLHRMVSRYKKRAGIQKKGGLHVFSRHSPATLMVASGCDKRVIKEILRHKSIMTTMRFAHVADRTVKEASEQYLKL
jgi:integrase/recombinase XerD